MAFRRGDRMAPGGTSKQPCDVFSSHKTAASIKHQERAFYSPTPRYQSAAAANNRPLKIVIHKHYLALFSAPRETRQTQTPASSPRRSPVCVAFISTCVPAVKGPGALPRVLVGSPQICFQTRPRWAPGLAPIRSISNNKTRNKTRPGRPAGS